jgi:hypothetical protein
MIYTDCECNPEVGRVFIAKGQVHFPWVISFAINHPRHLSVPHRVVLSSASVRDNMIDSILVNMRERDGGA